MKVQDHNRRLRLKKDPTAYNCPVCKEPYDSKIKDCCDMIYEHGSWRCVEEIGCPDCPERKKNVTTQGAQEAN